MENLLCLTWNIEGFQRSFLEIRQVLDQNPADLVFLSEPWLFQCDLHQATQLLHHDYKMYLNSDDVYDPELPLLHSRAHGGTLTLWKAELDPFISILPSETSRISAILLDLPEHQTTVHINVYLPTSGKEAEFISTLGTLQVVIEDAKEAHPTALIYVKGDANASVIPRPNNKRDQAFISFCESNRFLSLSLNNHKTYHHFMGDGSSDSNIDVCLSSSTSADGIPSLSKEKLLGILCCKDDVLASNSHHVIILSSIELCYQEATKRDSSPDIPTIENTRHKIVWSDEKLDQYCDLVKPVLAQLQDTWLVNPSPSTLSILLQQTNNVLAAAAKSTQKVVFLNKEHREKKERIPDDLKAATVTHSSNHSNLKRLLSNPDIRDEEIVAAKLQFKKSEQSSKTLSGGFLSPKTLNVMKNSLIFSIKIQGLSCPL